MRIALTGNPNSGKTTMYNALTGRNEKVGNWAGVTVEKKEHHIKKAYCSGTEDLIAVDLPGAYSMSPFTSEESITSSYVKHEHPDAIINIVDATNLSRSLFFTTQLLELGIPVVVALNKSDINAKKQTVIDVASLSAKLGCPVVETVSTAAEGLKAVVDAAVAQSGKIQRAPYVQGDIDLTDKKVVEEADRKRFAFVNSLVSQVEKRKVLTKDKGTGDAIDAVLTNKFLGIPIFAVVMFLVFQISQVWVGPLIADTLVAWIETFQGYVGEVLLADANPLLTALLADGIIGGVGAVVGFLPLVMIMYFLIALLEDCGYMARIAFIMDRIFRRFGLSGKSFIPMLVATGCGVPGIMASRTIEQDRDRKMTIMTTGFIPCGAKMPIIGLFAGALFGGSAWVATSAYFIGVAAVILSGVMLKKTRPFAGEPAPFVMELPAYHAPTAGNVLRATWERGWSFIKRAGTVILASSIILWFLQGFGWENGAFGLVEDMNNSVLAAIGSAVAFIFAPLGFGNWRATVAVVTGLIAKENVVATFGVLYNFAGELSENGDEIWALVAQDYTAISAYSFMIFNLLCAPCFAAMGAIKREMNNAKWTAFAIGYMCVFAYVVSLIVYQIGGLITGEVSFGIGTVVAVVLVVGIVYLLFRKNKYEDERLTIRSVDAAGRRAALK